MYGTYSSDKERSTDRILVLKIIDGKKPTSSLGNVDTRLFKGENKLHAIMDPRTCLWYFKYDSGALPEPLKQKFTSFNKLLEFARAYFVKRNIEIAEVID